HPATTQLYTLSLHDALPIFGRYPNRRTGPGRYKLGKRTRTELNLQRAARMRVPATRSAVSFKHGRKPGHCGGPRAADALDGAGGGRRRKHYPLTRVGHQMAERHPPRPKKNGRPSHRKPTRRLPDEKLHRGNWAEYQPGRFPRAPGGDFLK